MRGWYLKFGAGGSNIYGTQTPLSRVSRYLMFVSLLIITLIMMVLVHLYVQITCLELQIYLRVQSRGIASCCIAWYYWFFLKIRLCKFGYELSSHPQPPYNDPGDEICTEWDLKDCFCLLYFNFVTGTTNATHFIQLTEKKRMSTNFHFNE
jgi:hypothetical protein